VAQEIVLKPRGTGKGAAKACRRENLTPAVIYGKSITPVAVALDVPSVRKIMTGIGVQIHHVKIEGSDFEGDVMVQDAVYDSVSGKPLHIDLHKISLTEKVKTEVHVGITGESALERAGLLLQRQLRDITIECLPTEIPSNVSIDVSHLSHGEAITAGQVELPAGVRLVTPAAEVIVVAVAPKQTEETSEEDAAAAEALAETKPESENQ